MIQAWWVIMLEQMLKNQRGQFFQMMKKVRHLSFLVTHRQIWTSLKILIPAKSRNRFHYDLKVRVENKPTEVEPQEKKKRKRKRKANSATEQDESKSS